MSSRDCLALLGPVIAIANAWFVARGLKRRAPGNLELISSRLCTCGCIHLAASCILASLGFWREASGVFGGMMYNSFLGMPFGVLLLKDQFSSKRLIVAGLLLVQFAAFIGLALWLIYRPPAS